MRCHRKGNQGRIYISKGQYQKKTQINDLHFHLPKLEKVSRGEKKRTIKIRMEITEIDENRKTAEKITETKKFILCEGKCN